MAACYHKTSTGDDTHQKKQRAKNYKGVTPITKNIIVVDESGNEYTSTYAKRAKGLVKNGRARWLDGDTICLVCPPDENLEDNEMENRAENMEPINVVCESEVPGTVQPAVTIADILARIDRIIEQGNSLPNIAANIKTIPMNEDFDSDIAAERAEAIRDIYTQREMTNRQMLTFLNRMYDDVAPKNPIGLKEKAVERLSGMDFAGVLPETAKVLMDTLNNLLM